MAGDQHKGLAPSYLLAGTTSLAPAITFTLAATAGLTFQLSFPLFFPQPDCDPDDVPAVARGRPLLRDPSSTHPLL